jgi:O-antigen ligase
MTADRTDEAGSHWRAPGSGRSLTVGAVVLLVAALLVGGATREGELGTALVRLLSLPVLMLALVRLAESPPPGARWPLMLLAAVIALPVLQLLPLPPDLWSALPGRGPVAETYRQAGIALPWAPLSLTPDATWNAALSLLPPAAMFTATMALDARARRAVTPWVLAVVAASIVLGILQVAEGPESLLRPYETTNASAAVGFFANRNHQASLLIAALPLAVFWTLSWFKRPQAYRMLFVTLGVGLVLGIVAGVGVSTSRAGVVLLAPAGVGCLLLALRSLRVKVSRRTALISLGVAVLGLLPAFAFGLVQIMERLPQSLAGDARVTAAPVVAAAGAGYLPFGSGLGSFDPVYRMLETPETMGNAFLNHAHNDYLELWLETGVFGPLLVLLALGWVAMRTARLWRDPGSGGMIGLAASLSVLLVVLHSAIDYPLRTAAMATLFAFACGCLVPPAERRAPKPSADVVPVNTAAPAPRRERRSKRR